MRVLILDFDLHGTAGGGQRVYCRLIEACPKRDFTVFRRGGEGVLQPAPNVRVIPFHEHYRTNDHGLTAPLQSLWYRYKVCCDFAASVREALGPVHFDVVDMPDYTTELLFIRQAMEAHGIGVGTVALAMHGTISRAFAADWAPERVSPEMLGIVLRMEDLQYRLADVRYAISPPYAHLWREATGLAPRLVDPLHISGAFSPDLAVAATGSGPPDLLFVGRRERGKGPDIFVDLAWAVGAEHYRALRIVGAESMGPTDTPSLPILRRALDLRGIEAEISDALPFPELEALFRGRTILVVPSRMDTLNLVVLEALRLGCPVFVSRQAGASHWLEEAFPELADLVIDLGCGRAAALRIRQAARDYDALRARVCAAIARRPLTPDDGGLAAMYVPTGPGDDALRRRYAALAERFRVANPPLPDPELRRRPASVVPGVIARAAEEVPQAAPHLAAIRDYAPPLGRLLGVVPRDGAEMARAVWLLNEAVGSHRSSRVDLFSCLRDLERARSDRLTAALYDLRILRWLGHDRLGRLDAVAETFAAEGYGREAEVVDAMYRDPETAWARCAELMRAQAERLRVNPERPLEILDDRRGMTQPRVSVIVSLYDAHAKMPALVENLAIQTLARASAVEVVLVDSGSPGREYAVFRDLAARYGLPMVYARSEARETIQSAWNRGIGLARAPYLCFYGVDEGMHPDCLAVLAGILDERPRVDWVIADSIVTEVDPAGVFARDVMKYDRAGLDREMMMLDTCYLNWVGGMYRRSIHDRFGYYDAGFRAAGDTEFKARILGRIEILHVPRTIGVFNNYPEARTTAHPRAEIEDQRAWYLHRTPAGMAALFDGRPVAEAERLFRHCLGYRKSYCTHVSTDFDLAASVARYMAERGDNPDFAARAQALASRLVGTLRAVDGLSLTLPAATRAALLRGAFQAAEAETPAAAALGLAEPARFGLFNDNRYEQHWWSWSAA